jgi:kynurenine formamidase
VESPLGSHGETLSSLGLGEPELGRPHDDGVVVERGQGLAEDTADLWISADVVGIGTDSCTLEVWPHPEGKHVPLHKRLIRDYGAYLMELLDLEGLAASGRFEFLFVGAALPIVGGTGSPMNPLAIL